MTMLSTSNILTLALLTTSAIAVPTPSSNRYSYTVPHHPVPGGEGGVVRAAPLLAQPITESQLLSISPASASCAGAPYPAECRTAAQAAPAISKAFAKYNITHPSVQAALISLMAYESGDFKYAVNHFPAPGRPGQGTRNMQMEEFNSEYAAYLGLGGGSGQLQGTRLTDVLNSKDEWSFGSAAWFVEAKCAFDVRRDMWGGGEAAWERYVTECVGGTVDEQRRGYWQRAVKVLGSA